MAVRQNLAGATTSPERGLGRPLWIVVAILKSWYPGGTVTTEIHPLDMATMGRDNSLGTIVATMDSSVVARPIKIVQIIQTTGIWIKIETSFEIILSHYDNRQYNNNSMSNSNFNFQNDQGYNSRWNQNYEGFNQDSSYRSQYNDQEVEENLQEISPTSDSYVGANRLSARPEHKLRRV